MKMKLTVLLAALVLILGVSLTVSKPLPGKNLAYTADPDLNIHFLIHY